MRTHRRTRVLFRFLLATLLVTAGAAPAQPQTPPLAPPRTRVGLALGGGGARGSAHVGVLLWLDEHRIPVDVVGGTSMGALIGGAFAAGMTPAELRVLVETMDWSAVLAPETPFAYRTFRRKEDSRAFQSQLRFGLRGGLKLPTGLSPAEQVDLLFDGLSAPFGSDVDFNALPTPFRCVAVDLRKAEVVVFDSGWLARALRSTMAIPGVFPPVEFGDRVLVDGGVLNNVPADVVRQTGLADRVIAVDIGADLAIEPSSDTALAVFRESVDAMMRSGARRGLSAADLVLIPRLKGVQTRDFGRARELVERGYEAAAAQAESLLPFALSQADYAAWAAARQARRPTATVVPTRVSVENVPAALPPGEAARIARRLARHHLGRPLDKARLDSDLLVLTGDGRYESATYRIDRSLGPAELVIGVRRPKNGPPFLSTALDLENTRTSTVGAAIRGRLQAVDVLGKGSEARVDLGVGNTLQASGELYRPLGTTGLFVSPRVYASRRDTPVFQGERYAAEYREYDAGASFDAGLSTFRRLEARLGYTVEHLRKDVRIGDPVLPSVSGTQQFALFRVVFDGQNGPTLPERGLYLKADVRRFFEVPDVRTPEGTGPADPDRLWSGRASFSAVVPLGRHGRFLVRGAGGTSFGETATVNGFTLGGPFDLGAYYPNELRGSNFAVANAGYFHEVGRFVEGTIGRLYVGAWVDQGATFERLADARVRTNVSGGILLESPIGPFFGGVSVGRDGRYRVYFSLGSFLPH
jgi:NTE family protein